MTKLTKKDRHEFYKRLLDFTVKDTNLSQGICHYIHRVIFDNYKSNSKVKKLHAKWNYNNVYFLELFLPELYNKAPKLWKKDPFGRHWYPVHSRKYWNMRIQHIFDCVNETA
jgi:hypothetical protein